MEQVSDFHYELFLKTPKRLRVTSFFKVINKLYKNNEAKTGKKITNEEHLAAGKFKQRKNE